MAASQKPTPLSTQKLASQKPAPQELTPQAWQQCFGRALLHGRADTGDVTPLHESFTTAAQPGFAVYQNNVHHSLTEALAELYPVVKQLVGETFFRGTARTYLQQHPPNRAAMVFFGGAFPTFLASFTHTQSLGYLADVAQLELSRQRSYHAADTPALTPDALADMAPSQFESSVLRLHPSVQMQASAYPIFTIWQQNQSHCEDHDTIDLHKPQWLLTVRHDYQLLTFEVDRGTYDFFRGLASGLVVAEAVNYALGSGEYAIANAIHLGLSQGFFESLVTEHS